jgi:hypothetical protein
MGKSESGECGFNWSEAGQAHDLSGRQKKNRSRAAGTVGEGTRCEQEGGLAAWEPAASYAQAFRLVSFRKSVLRNYTSQLRL